MLPIELICPDCKKSVVESPEGFECIECKREMTISDEILIALPSQMSGFSVKESQLDEEGEKYENHNEFEDFIKNPWKILLTLRGIKQVLRHEKDIIPYIKDSHKILEIGAHTGRTALITKLLVPKATIYCSDISRKPIIITKHLFDYFNLFNGRYFIVCDAQNLPFSDGMFDAIYCNSTIHHMEDPVACLKHIYRTLKVGGVFMAHGESAFSSITIKFSKIYFKEEQAFAKKKGYLERKFTFLQWQEMLEKAGFSHYQIILDKNVEFAPNNISAFIRRLNNYFPDGLIRKLGSPIYVYAKK